MSGPAPLISVPSIDLSYLSVVKSDPELFPIEMQSKDSPFREI